ncbi:MAG: hypothetical protein PHY02_09760 [Phycisphaerae bacterium]|nr:hypothetical protein [Phycisphaerae bacterium]
MLFKMVQQAGGKLNFPCQSLNLPVGSMLHITYDDKTDSFDVECAIVEQKVIIEPDRKLVTP